MPAPTALVSTWDLVADDYLTDIVPHFERFADAAIALIEDVVSIDGARVADVACGPGTFALLAGKRGATVSALDFSAAMVAHLRQRADADAVVVDVVVGDGQALPWRDASFDAAVSMFGLMFFPDRAAGLRELHRVVRPGGVVVVSSWVPIDQVPILHDAVTTLMTAAAAPPMPAVTAPLSSPALVRDELEAAGFVDVDVAERSVLVPFASPRAFLEWTVRSTAPVVLMKQRLGDDAFADVFARWDVAMMEKYGAGPVEYPLVALLGSGRRRR
ncbi:MAG TPA: class I SAM-dependent methyltransferase [Myxococcota bacterium]